VAGQVGPLAVVVEDGEDLGGPLVRVNRVRGHRGELGCLSFANENSPLTQTQTDGSAEHGEPFVARMHAGLARVALRSDPHLGDGDAAAVTLPREQPRRRTGARLRLGSDHDIVIALGLDELVERRAKRSGNGHELIQCDPPVPSLDTAQRRRRQVAAGRECVEGPPSSDAKSPDALPYNLIKRFLRNKQDFMRKTQSLSSVAT
jgi:hypothetical protein